jgi:hypothetical protein
VRGALLLSVSGTASTSALRSFRPTTRSCLGGKKQGQLHLLLSPRRQRTSAIPKKTWMVNFRVRDLDAMVAQLRGAGISVEIDQQRYPNGRFARLNDPEGNPIQLWEPEGRLV